MAAGLALALAACTNHQAQPAAPTAGTTTAPADAKPKPRLNGRGKVTSLSLERFFELHQAGQVLVYDARSPVFYRMSHIPGAINLPKTSTEGQISAHEEEVKAALAAGKTIVFYCARLTCPDARTMAHRLSGRGYPAAIFSSGMEAWQNAGLPTE